MPHGTVSSKMMTPVRSIIGCGCGNAAKGAASAAASAAEGVNGCAVVAALPAAALPRGGVLSQWKEITIPRRLLWHAYLCMQQAARGSVQGPLIMHIAGDVLLRCMPLPPSFRQHLLQHPLLHHPCSTSPGQHTLHAHVLRRATSPRGC